MVQLRKGLAINDIKVRTVNQVIVDSMLTEEENFYYIASEDEENVYLQLETT